MYHLVKIHLFRIASFNGIKQIMSFKRFKKLNVHATILNFEKSLFQKVASSCGKKQITTVKSFIVHATMQHLVKSHIVRIFIILA
jgi:hypothetical protein